MKLIQLANPGTQQAFERLMSQPVPAKVAFQLKKIVEIASAELAKYEEVRKETIAKYGLRDTEGNLVVDDKNQIQFSEESMKLLIAELNDLGGVNVELPSIAIIDLKDIKISTNDLIALDGMITE